MEFCSFAAFPRSSVFFSSGQKGAKGLAGDPGTGLPGPDGPQGLRGTTLFFSTQSFLTKHLPKWSGVSSCILWAGEQTQGLWMIKSVLFFLYKQNNI